MTLMTDTSEQRLLKRLSVLVLVLVLVSVLTITVDCRLSVCVILQTELSLKSIFNRKLSEIAIIA